MKHLSPIFLFCLLAASCLFAQKQDCYIITAAGKQQKAISIQADAQGNLTVNVDGKLKASFKAGGYKFAVIPKPKEVADLEKLANEEKYEELIYSAGSEAAANAKKHADASVLYADISSAGDELIIRFSDNGSPKRPFRGEGGGLKDLRSRAESQGGRLETDTAQSFAVTLYLKIPGETANV